MIRKSDIFQAGILVLLATAFSFVMMINDYNRILADFESGSYEVYEGSYNDFNMFETGLTVADNGAVYRNVYLGYINNTIIDDEFMNLSEGETIEDLGVEELENAKWETIFKMVFLHFHYLMAILMFLMYRVVDYILVGVIGANKLFIRHKGDLSDDNFDNVLQDFKCIYAIYYNKMQIAMAILFGLVTTFIIRMSINLDDFRLVIMTIILYSFVSILNYILKKQVDDKGKKGNYTGDDKDKRKEDKENLDGSQDKNNKENEGKDVKQDKNESEKEI